MKPSPRACDCSRIPAVRTSLRGAVFILRIECKCGKRGAAMLYTRPKDNAFMRQAAIDGWNLRI